MLTVNLAAKDCKFYFTEKGKKHILSCLKGSCSYSITPPYQHRNVMMAMICKKKKKKKKNRE